MLVRIVHSGDHCHAAYVKLSEVKLRGASAMATPRGASAIATQRGASAMAFLHWTLGAPQARKAPSLPSRKEDSQTARSAPLAAGAPPHTQFLRMLLLGIPT